MSFAVQADGGLASDIVSEAAEVLRYWLDVTGHTLLATRYCPHLAPLKPDLIQSMLFTPSGGLTQSAS